MTGEAHAETPPSQPAEMSLELLLAFCKAYDVIESYCLGGRRVEISNLGVRYVLDSSQAVDVLLRLLRERPTLAETARRIFMA